MPDIQDTGTKGFLKWWQQWAPGVYAKVAGQLPARAPQLFSDFEQGGGLAGARQRRLAGLGDDLTPIDLSAAVDTTAGAPDTTVDVSDAANSTATDVGTANWLSSLINGVSSAYLTVTQQQSNQAIINAQLQRAQQGLPPLAISPGSNGVPIISAGLGGSSGLLIAGGLALLAVLAFASSRR